MYCKISVILAYAMAIYCISCIYYLIRNMWLDTPFKKSLTKKQLEIKKQSVYKRKNVFIEGLIIGLFIMVLLRPFNKC